MARRLPTPTPTVPIGLASSGGLADEAQQVFGEWAAQGLHSPQSLAGMTETIHRFVRRADLEGYARFADVTPALAAAFVTAPTSKGPADVSTQQGRRTALRVLYRTLRELRLADGDPTLDLALPPKGWLAARPLTDDEVILCRATAQMTGKRGASLRATAWALGEATAVSSEITAVTIADLDDPLEPTTVRLPGTRRHDPRTAELTDWGSRVLAARAHHLLNAGAPRSTLLAYGGAAPPGGPKAQASVCNALREVMRLAGLTSEPDVRPSSLRHWAGRSAYLRGEPIEAVARRLGLRSLDSAAEDIALRWREPQSVEPGRTR